MRFCLGSQIRLRNQIFRHEMGVESFRKHGKGGMLPPE